MPRREVLATVVGCGMVHSQEERSNVDTCMGQISIGIIFGAIKPEIIEAILKGGSNLPIEDEISSGAGSGRVITTSKSLCRNPQLEPTV